MAEQHMLDLIDRLLKIVDKVEWNYDSSTDGYFVSVAPHLVEIRSVDRDQRHPYSLVILHGPDDVVESVFSSEEGLPQEYIEKLARLYQEAKRAEKNLEGVINSILDRLPEG